jgi:S1-C subfamily serine protease
VTAVYPESVADKAGVMRGDVILSFNDQDFKDVLDLQQKMAKESKLFRLKINRGGKIKFIAFALPSFLNSLP